MLGALGEKINPALLVGYDTSDDACVYSVRDDLVLIQTVDFFPPIVDDAFTYGQIAAANALSDIYAMGASPSLALNILCVPSALSEEDVAAILAGGASKVHEAGAVIAGGHSVEDNEPKYGMCVSAFAHPNAVWSNAGALPGDVLVLTKPIGNGILATAAKQDKISQNQFSKAIEVMCALNKYARDAAAAFKINACTDVTGFGLLGHAAEMADASGVSLEICAVKVPLLDGVVELAQAGVVPGGAGRNAEYLADKVSIDVGVPLYMQKILNDPQTSGGLLFSVAKEVADVLLPALKTAGVFACAIGNVLPRGKYSILVK